MHFAFILGASGSGDTLTKTLNGVAELQNTSSDSIVNEPITWNWNPQASYKSNYQSHNCYGQKRNRNVNSSTDEVSTSGSATIAKNLSIWSHDDIDGTDEKNSNFWSKMFAPNNNGNGNNAGSSKDQRRTNNFFPSPSNTAVRFNSIISNLKDHHPNSIDLGDLDAVDRNFNMSDAIIQNACDGNASASASTAAAVASIPSGSESTYHAKSKNLSQKHKTGKNHRTNHTNDASNHFKQSNDEATAGGDFRMSLNNDLNAANSTFLRALNDLHLDYNDLTTATNAMVNRQDHGESAVQSKER